MYFFYIFSSNIFSFKSKDHHPPVAGFFWTDNQLPNQDAETYYQLWMLGLIVCLSH